MSFPNLFLPSRTGLALFGGDRACLAVATWAAARAFLGGTGAMRERASRLIAVDAGNAFDPYIISDVARAAGEAPEQWLARVRIARAFTLHQLDVLVAERLPVLCGDGNPVLLLSLLDLFGDEAVPTVEARRILRRILWTLQDLVKRRCPVLVACPDPGRPASWEASLLPPLRRLASWVLHVQAAGDGSYLVTRERPTPATWRWTRLSHPATGEAPDGTV